MGLDERVTGFSADGACRWMSNVCETKEVRVFGSCVLPNLYAKLLLIFASS